MQDLIQMLDDATERAHIVTAEQMQIDLAWLRANTQRDGDKRWCATAARFADNGRWLAMGRRNPPALWTIEMAWGDDAPVSVLQYGHA